VVITGCLLTIQLLFSDEMQKQQKEKREKELQAKALVAMNNKLRAWTMVNSKK
jgi:hypothetical protein